MVNRKNRKFVAASGSFSLESISKKGRPWILKYFKVLAELSDIVRAWRLRVMCCSCPASLLRD